ncbi:MAG: type I-E CRISPR-associated protein Cas5/CasD [Acidobacteria bacterium]|nr:type I-E CRISPR-associated protein Cas5/CasD [Acidobacteriota bacterium]
MNEPYTLLLRLEGPMQSWGYRSRFDYRDTALEPTRSGVIGLICAAMGIARGEDISRFGTIQMGVRVDKEGRPERDYHTALNVIKADGSGADTVVSYRDYLADATFTVGLESSNRSFLKEIESALGNPMWPLFLGRKAFCLTEHPLSASLPAIIQASLHEALESAAFSLRCKPRTGLLRCRFVLETEDGERTQHDWPLCFRERRFKSRSVQTKFEGETA